MSQAAVTDREAPLSGRLGRQEIRTRETRDLLMRAAKTIFIRDGYEGTDLNDIADLAGRTKGAIYGHFKSKEDIFLALIENHRKEYREKLEKLLMHGEADRNIAVMRGFLVELAEDDDWALLQLEFKMFALRHPETKERFQNLQSPTGPDREKIYAKLLGPAGKQSVSRAITLHSIVPMLSALLLEARFEPDLLTTDAIKKLIGGVFDFMVGE